MKLPKIICLDFEGSLVSNAISLISRPGLFDFLEFCRQNFTRVAIFTYVDEQYLRGCIRKLFELGEVPKWFIDVEYIDWKEKPESEGKRYKDLRCVPGVEIDEILIIDDMPILIREEQKTQYIYIEEFGAPYSDEDRELEKITEILKVNYLVLT